ncbi:tRNA 2-thiouridine(34) synthase MnmA [Candidatus Dojkabacteria bacterium HGW-Dojkabacteria-1]|uniref:tRNA-specific 2-thiouridylase MnmA n=1 Tax=Candidatus Dojkabacteria bacterium HGW-Dojkabacteria-1 TaxID=2013761 RepID=A0A2N2F3U0_9BACT|nr:MAG: tRNA 2-thiouridine(34) synthase MnmA [Candidatus Dojkabacteria bacterium HGW-Dojkabacteria-1]
MEKKNKQKVMLGMSGGVDSSVAAYLLQQEGYEVIGVTMQIWTDTSNDDGCCSLSAVEDARRVANKLGIAYYVFNMKEDFQKYVIEYFVKEYESGRTPNPCIACNRYVKFGSLLDKAKSMNIDYVATGHYAIIEKVEGRYLLKKAIDDTKDQSYVLYNLNQEQLSKTLFPLGKYKKSEIREIAKELGFGVASKPDSQEICFVDDNDYNNFIKTHSNNTSSIGEIVDIQGNVLGHHNGITKFTIGQRRGLGIALGKPMFVVDIDIENNRVILGENDDLFVKEIYAYDLNWISIDKLDKPLRIKAKIRYKAQEQDATVEPLEEGRVKIIFDEKQRAATPGQSVVFYKDNTVVGGGIIEK